MCVTIYTHLCLEKKTEGKFPGKAGVSESVFGCWKHRWMALPLRFNMYLF